MWTALLTLALAQEPPSAARLCANAAEGAEVDVCLSLAATYPLQVDGITAALRAHIDRAEASDRDLMLALLALSSEDEGIDGAERLALIGDPRAVSPLMVAAQTRLGPVSDAAARALGEFPEAHEALATWMMDKDRDMSLRKSAARTLAEFGGDVGADALVAAIRRRSTPGSLRDEILGALQVHQPERRAQMGIRVRRDGTVFLVAAGSLGMGQALGATGYLGRGSLAGAGVVTGAVAGGTIGWVYGRARPMEAHEASFIAANGALGIASGTLIGAALTDGSEAGAWAGGAAGNVLGFSLATAFRHSDVRSSADVFESTLFAVTAATTLGTGFNFVRKSRWRARVQPDNTGINWGMLGSGVGLLAGGVVGSAIAPSVSLSKPDVLLISLSSAFGLGVGLAAPAPGFRRGLPIAGLTGGMLIGYAISGVSEPRPDSIVGAATGTFYGGAIGAGMGLLVDAQATSAGNVPRGFALVGAGIGLATGAAVANGNPEFLDPSDLAFVSLVTTAASLQSGALWAGLAPPFRTRGWFVVGPSAVGAVAAMTTPLVDVPTHYSFSGASLGVWGGWFGFAGATVADGFRSDRYLWSMAGADIGLAVGLLAAAPPFNLPPLVVALADAGGVVGGSLGALGTSFATGDPNQILIGSIAGSATGLVVGTTVGLVVRSTGNTTDMALAVPHIRIPGTWTATPTVLVGDDGMVPGVVLVGAGF